VPGPVLVELALRCCSRALSIFARPSWLGRCNGGLEAPANCANVILRLGAENTRIRAVPSCARTS